MGNNHAKSNTEQVYMWVQLGVYPTGGLQWDKHNGGVVLGIDIRILIGYRYDVIFSF